MSQKKDLVSVVVNCHNSEKYVTECINSIINQSYKDLEIIVWDNNSHDQTYEIINKLAIVEKRLKLYKGEKFLTLGSARNNALNKCSGDWIAFLDSDDVWEQNFLSDQMNALKGKENAFFGYGHVTIFYDLEFPKLQDIDRSVSIKYDIFQNLLKGNFIFFSTLVISRSALNYVKSFNGDFVQAEDYELLLRLAQKFKALQVGHAYYRIHADNTSKKQTTELHEENMKSLKPHLSNYPAKMNYSFSIAKLATLFVKNRNILKLREVLSESKYNIFYLIFGLFYLFAYKMKKIISR